MSNANGIFDNPVFDQAGTLSDMAGRYSGSPDLSGDATALNRIAKSDQTSVGALIDATQQIAKLCDVSLSEGSGEFGGLVALGAGGNSGNYNSGSGSDGSGGSGNSPDSGQSDEGQSDTGRSDTGPDTSSTGSSAVTDESSALAALQQQRDTDRAAVEQLADS